MKKFAFTLAALMMSGSIAAAECTKPETPDLPDGSSASKKEMIEGQQAVKQFQSANAEYRNCLDQNIADVKAEMKKKAKAAKKDSSNVSKDELKAIKAKHDKTVKAYNKAVSNEKEVAKQFNNSIKAYKSQ